MDEESMVKLARYLSEKRMRLVDMFKVLDKVNSKQMSKDDFARRMKVSQNLVKSFRLNQVFWIVLKFLLNQDIRAAPHHQRHPSDR
jgi:hypothetical protein